MTVSITIGIDPHREVFTASVLDERGRRMSHEHFNNNHVGHAEVLKWPNGMGTWTGSASRGPAALADRWRSSWWAKAST